MSVLGITGLTAYFGMLEVGRPADGETVVVSAAVGVMGVSLGNLPAFTVRGWSVSLVPTRSEVLVDTLGFDASVNYRSDTFRKDLRGQCPSGVDVYFDNARGGSTLETMLRLMNVHGRIACCGAVSQYDTSDPGPGPSGVPGTHRDRIGCVFEGFLASDFPGGRPRKTPGGAGPSGCADRLEDVMDGRSRPPRVGLGLLAGDNISGKRTAGRAGPGIRDVSAYFIGQDGLRPVP